MGGAQKQSSEQRSRGYAGGTVQAARNGYDEEEFVEVTSREIGAKAAKA